MEIRTICFGTNEDTLFRNKKYMPIFWPISMYFSRYLADTDITDIQSSDTVTETDMADTDISVSAKYIG